MIVNDGLCYGQPINWSNPLNRGLISRWKVVPWYASGPRLIDLAGVPSKNHGTLTNGPTWQGSLGRPGGSGSLKFVGASSHGVNCGATTSVIANNSVTVSCWMNPGVTTRGDLVTKWLNGNSTDDAFNLLYGLTSGKPQFYVTNPGVLIASSGVGSTSMTVGTWNYVVGIYDGSTVSVYLNGSFQSSTSATLTMANAGTRTIWIGRNADVDGYSTASIDDVCIFNRAFSASEIAAIYLATQRPDDPTLNWLPMRAYSFGVTAAATGGPFPHYTNRQLTGGLLQMSGGL